MPANCARKNSIKFGREISGRVLGRNVGVDPVGALRGARGRASGRASGRATGRASGRGGGFG